MVKIEELKQILTKLRKSGYSRTQLKDIVDEICNNVYIEILTLCKFCEGGWIGDGLWGNMREKEK